MNDARLMRLVIVVGVASGLIGAAYVGVMKLMIRLLGPEHFGDVAHLVILGAVGAAIGGLTLLLGNPGDVELLVDNIHVSGGRDDIRDLRSLIPVSLIGIGAGSAIGPEAPLVQTTGSLGSWVAHRYGLDVSELRILTITGMAAGFTVLFGVPLGSAVFALEILHRQGLQYFEAVLPSAIGALAGYAVFIVVRKAGIESVWHFPDPHHVRAGDLLVGLGSGVVGAAIAAAFTYFSHFERYLFKRVPAGLRPALGGLAIGGLAFASTYALTFGEGQINTIVAAKLSVGTLLVAALCKFVASSTMVTTGWRGGFIIPLFFLGVVLGTVFSREFHTDRVVTMVAMMAACNVGVTKTPFGSTLVVSGMAGVRVLPTTLLASIVALLLTSRVSMIETQRERISEIG